MQSGAFSDTEGAGARRTALLARYTSSANGRDSSSGIQDAAARAGGEAGQDDFIPYAINFGGPAYTPPSTGLPFRDGTSLLPHTVGVLRVQVSDIVDALPNKDYALIYATAVHVGNRFDWVVPNLPRGVYTVHFYFAELYYPQPGGRVYDLFVQNEQVAADFDPFLEPGGGARRGIVKSISGVKASAGFIHVRVQHGGGRGGNLCFNALSVDGDVEASREYVKTLPIHPKVKLSEVGVKPVERSQPLTRGFARRLTHGNFSCHVSDLEAAYGADPTMGEKPFFILGDPKDQAGLQGPGKAANPLPFLWISHPSPKLGPLGLQIVGPNGHVPLHPHGRFLGFGDHVFLYNVYVGGEYRILSKGQQVANFSTHPEGSMCPEIFGQFESRYQCSKADEARVENVMSRWNEGIQEAEWIRFRDQSHQCVFHFTVIDNELFWKRPAVDPWHQLVIDFVHSLLRKARIPDVEFLFDCADLARTDAFHPTPPVFSFSARTSDGDVLMPHPYMIDDIYLTGLNIREASMGPLWEERQPKAYFRGANSAYKSYGSMEELKFDRRWKAYFWNRQRPDLFNVRLNDGNPNAFRDPGKTLKAEILKRGYFHAPDPRENELRYRYLLVLDGSCAPGRTAAALTSGALVMKQTSFFVEYFYDLLRPCHHYVPLDHFLNNLPDNVEWANKYSRSARQIQLNGFQFAMERLRSQDMICYMAYLLRALGVRQKFQAKVREGMVPLPQPAQDPARHTCQFGGPPKPPSGS